VTRLLHKRCWYTQEEIVLDSTVGMLILFYIIINVCVEKISPLEVICRFFKILRDVFTISLFIIKISIVFEIEAKRKKMTWGTRLKNQDDFTLGSRCRFVLYYLVIVVESNWLVKIIVIARSSCHGLSLRSFVALWNNVFVKSNWLVGIGGRIVLDLKLFYYYYVFLWKVTDWLRFFVGRENSTRPRCVILSCIIYYVLF